VNGCNPIPLLSSSQNAPPRRRKGRRRPGREAADVVACDVQGRRLAAEREQEAVVERRQVRDGDEEEPARREHPPRLADRSADVLERDEELVRDHDVERFVRVREAAAVELHLSKLRVPPSVRIPVVDRVVDDRAGRGRKLVAPDERLDRTASSKVEETSAAGPCRDQCGDLGDDGGPRPRVPPRAGGRTPVLEDPAEVRMRVDHARPAAAAVSWLAEPQPVGASSPGTPLSTTPQYPPPWAWRAVRRALGATAAVNASKARLWPMSSTTSAPPGRSAGQTVSSSKRTFRPVCRLSWTKRSISPIASRRGRRRPLLVPET
jgi:hypothetical protein